MTAESVVHHRRAMNGIKIHYAELVPSRRLSYCMVSTFANSLSNAARLPGSFETAIGSTFFGRQSKTGSGDDWWKGPNIAGCAKPATGRRSSLEVC